MDKTKKKPTNRKFKVKPKKVIKPEKLLTKDEYTAGYKELQALWKSKNRELLLVGRLAYWTYWISKIAENSDHYTDKRTQFFMLKKNGLILLSKSNYVQIKKYVPAIHKKMCHKHVGLMRKNKMKPFEYTEKRSRMVLECPKCAEGLDHQYTLYSVAILNEKEDIEGRKPLFIMNSPYHLIKDEFPPLDSLESVKKYYGNESISIAVDKFARNVNIEAFTEETVIKYFTKNYEELSNYLKRSGMY